MAKEASAKTSRAAIFSRKRPKLSRRLPTNSWLIPELTIKITNDNCTALLETCRSLAMDGSEGIYMSVAKPDSGMSAKERMVLIPLWSAGMIRMLQIYGANRYNEVFRYVNVFNCSPFGHMQ